MLRNGVLQVKTVIFLCVHNAGRSQMAEAFVKTFKRDYVYTNELSSAVKVQDQLPGWFKDYNENAPHSALKMMAPKEYIRAKSAG